MVNREAGRRASDAEWQRLLDRVPLGGIYGVVTTGIVCVSGCPARTPLRQNVRVFATAEAAVSAGYRRCKRCGAGATAALPRN